MENQQKLSQKMEKSSDPRNFRLSWSAMASIITAHPRAICKPMAKLNVSIMSWPSAFNESRRRREMTSAIGIHICAKLSLHSTLTRSNVLAPHLSTCVSLRVPTELPRTCRRIHRRIYRWDHVHILCIHAQSAQTSTRTIYSTHSTRLNMNTQSQQLGWACAAVPLPFKCPVTQIELAKAAEYQRGHVQDPSKYRTKAVISNMFMRLALRRPK